MPLVINIALGSKGNFTCKSTQVINLSLVAFRKRIERNAIHITLRFWSLFDIQKDN